MDLAAQVKQDQVKFLAAQEQRLKQAGEFIRSKLKEVLSKQGGKDQHATRGEPPLKQSGKLFESVKVRMEKDVVVIYSDADYASFLEKNHPWFRTTIEGCRADVEKIIKGW